MEGNCYLEVDVNGEEVFLVDKRVISSYSGRMSKLLGKMRDATGNVKVIFHGFPGGAESFELITRFCYDKGKAGIINASNILPLASAAHFMEIEHLSEQIERSLEEINHWSLSEVVMALKQQQRVGGAVLDKLLSSLVGRIVSCSETSPSSSAASSSGSSCDGIGATWWFEELVALDARVVEMVTRQMALRRLDSGLIIRFLLHYLKSRSASASLDERVGIVEEVVEMLGILDVRCVSCKSLFELLRVVMKVRVSRRCRNVVEGAIGSLLDQARLDDLLIPSSPSRCYLYNVNLVLSFLRSFLGEEVGSVPLSRMARVAGLVDSYLAEIAPDPWLKPSKFLAVVRALPDSARDSFDAVYHAVNLYLEVHRGLSEEERRILCCSINYEKLSPTALSHLIGNARFPWEHVALALVSRRSKLRSLLRPAGTTYEGGRVEGCDQVVLYARQLNASDKHKKVKPRLQGMQTRVSEVEMVCRKMQPQNVKMRKSRTSRLVYGRSLPLLCS
ncbi:BTB/POZ domain-containing protein At3g22104-like [Salvia miltiorrhiza]|uniref:BTB/POZ domain-containing protein At3g22104-like n=1 Tax=Salvia miltiorrhiza TaxID=226208 RepID=UPI0025AC0706|nr:BTB/POZ domain-containing protein At3g22104-like [Salvia miltiorrhiza]